MYKSATNVPNDAKWGIMPNVLNTDPILSAPNATGVPNVNTAQNVPKMTNPSVPKNHLMYNWRYVPTGVPNELTLPTPNFLTKNRSRVP